MIEQSGIMVRQSMFWYGGIGNSTIWYMIECGVIW